MAQSLIARIDIEIIKNTLFLDKVAGYSAVGLATYQSAMNVITIKRGYAVDKHTIKMQLVSIGAAGTGSPLAGFAALAQQYEQQQDQVRLGRRIMVNVTPAGSSIKLMAAIGGYNLEVSGADKERLIAFYQGAASEKFET